MAGVTCPICGVGELERFLDLPQVPVVNTVFYADHSAAVAAPRGDLHLAVCRHCALVWNVAFDPSLVDYTGDYENSQHFSPAFQTYARELAERLATTYDLAGRTVVEIGSGKGEFLALLGAAFGCRGVGFDPTFDGQVDESDGRVQIVRRYYDAVTASGLDPALIVARHVLEHLADPLGFLRAVRAVSGPNTPVYYEVPNAESVFSDDGMWDLIYQHVGYLSAPTLGILLRRAGYEVVEVGTAFHEQFLWIEGRPGGEDGSAEPDVAAVEEICARVGSVGTRLRQHLNRWREELSLDRNDVVVLWGAGAKGVAFLNMLDVEHAIDLVVDVNPRKVGKYVPGTAHRIEPPATLRDREVSSVLCTNRAYEGEINAELQRLDCAAKVETV